MSSLGWEDEVTQEERSPKVQTMPTGSGFSDC